MKFTILRDPDPVGGGGGESTETPAESSSYNPFEEDFREGTEKIPPGQVVPEETAPAPKPAAGGTPSDPNHITAEQVEADLRKQGKVPPEPVVPSIADGLTVEQLTAAIAKLGLSVGPAAPATPSAPAPPPPPTQEEIDEAFGVYKPNAEVAAGLLSGEPEKVMQSINQIVSGAVNQAVRTAKLYMKVMEKEIRQDITPITQNMAAQTREKLKADFITAWPDSPKFEAILVPEYERLVKTGASFDTMEQAVAHMQKHVEATMGKVIPGFKLSAAQPQPNGKPPTGAPLKKPAQKMATASAGGQGGGATGAEASEKENPQAKWLFGGGPPA